MSFVGLSLRSTRVLGLRPTKILANSCRTLQVSCRRLENDSGNSINKETEAKDKLAQLLKDIREAKAKKTETEAVAGEN